MGSITLFTKNILETGTLTVTGTPDTGYPEARLHDRAKSLYWKDTVTEAKDFTVDAGAAVEIDFLAIANHNFSGETFEFQYSTDNFSADVNDAVDDWVQGDNEDIFKEMSASQTKRYWQVTMTSMVNPQCGEIFMSLGHDLEVLATDLEKSKITNIRWNRTVGDIERSTKFGDRRRRRSFQLLLDSTTLATLRTALDELATAGHDLGPFYIKDLEGDYWLARFVSDPLESYEYGHRHVTLDIVEVLG